MSSSRLCVKNIPKHVSEQRLRELFSSKGEVTDVKVLRTKDGRSRQIAFVGFRDSDQADGALRFFHRTFLDTSRLTVELARKVSDKSSEEARPWSKYSKGSSAYQKSHDASQAEQKVPKNGKAGTRAGIVGDLLGEDEKDDPKLAEFLAVMQPRAKTQLWANDDVLPDGCEKSARGKQSFAKKSAAGVTAKKSKAGAKPGIAVERGIESGDEPDEGDADSDRAIDRGEESQNDDDDASHDSVDDEATALGQKNVSDLDYLRSKVVSDRNFEDESDETPSVSSDNEDAVSDGTAEDSGGPDTCEDMPETSDVPDSNRDNPESNDAELQDEEVNAHMRRSADDGSSSIAETGRLFLRNLPYSATEDDIRDLFSEYGELSEVHLVLDRERKTSRGVAFVSYLMPEDAVKAHQALDATDFQGRLLHILAAKLPPTANAAKLESQGGSSYKKQKEEQLKSQAGNRTAWNSLFMRQDTVAEAIAAHFGVSKSELLDRDSADLPVRMALGETHVIASTKKALGDARVRVELLEAAATSRSGAAVKRSDTCILAKNLPYAVSEEELKSMFESVGPLSRLVLPSTKTLAIVEFVEAQDARRAFRSLAYKRCHHVPLYLEWAPDGIFSGEAATLSRPPAVIDTQVSDATVLAGLAEDDGPDGDGSRELYVKNLNFETRDKALQAHFQAAASSAGGRLTSAKVALKSDGKTGRKLSLGFGFIEFSSEATARAVMKAMQGSSLDGHKLILQLTNSSTASKHRTADKKASKDESKTKLVIRNVAFEATRKDLAEIFGAVGQLKSLRLPKKFDGSHRGFAFAEFVTQQEAQNAVDTLSGTHLYGRRLVVERAKEDGGLEDIRDKTAAKFRGEDSNTERPPVKKMKKSVGDSFADFL